MVRPVAWECPDCEHPFYGRDLRQIVDEIKAHYYADHPVTHLRKERAKAEALQAISE